MRNDDYFRDMSLLPDDVERRYPRCVHAMRVGAVLAAALVAGGCNGSRNCTRAGAESGVRVRGGEDSSSVRICAGAVCGTTPVFHGVGFVKLPSLRPGRSADLTVTYTSPNRRVTSRVAVVPAKFQPNGPDCEPTAAAAMLKFDAAGRASG